MNTKRVYFVMLGLNILLVLSIIGTVVVGDKLLSKESEKLVAHKLENAVLEKEQVSLAQAKADLEKYKDLEQISSQIVPQEKDQALTVREVVLLANKAGVKIGSIGFPSSTLGNNKATAPTPTEGGSSTPAAPKIDITQTKPVTGIKGLYELPVTIASDPTRPSSYNQVISFLSNLENNRRTAQVSQISILPDTKNPSLLGFTLTITVYIKP